MPHLLDTNVLIGLRDGAPALIARLPELSTRPFMSIVSQIELENGVVRDAAERDARAKVLDELLREFTVLPFTTQDAARYRLLIADAGYSRTRTLYRMIAATALRVGATLVTANVRDFRDVPGLDIEDWSN